MKKKPSRGVVVPEVLRLWVILTNDEWARCKARGSITQDGRRMDEYDRTTERWFKEQMRKRLAHYTGRFPVWAWYEPKPDLRGSALLASGTKGVRIECKVPSARALLVDDDGYCIVANRSFFSRSGREDEAFDRKAGSCIWGLDDLSEPLQEEVRRSWERAFDLGPRTKAQRAWLGDHGHVWAILETVRMEEVVRVTKCIAR